MFTESDLQVRTRVTLAIRVTRRESGFSNGSSIQDESKTYHSFNLRWKGRRDNQLYCKYIYTLAVSHMVKVDFKNIDKCD
jgi:hypothetical protein